MTTRYNLTHQDNAQNGWSRYVSNTNYDTTLAATTEQTLTVPGINSSTYRDEYIAVITYNYDARVWLAINETATVPGAAFATTNSILLKQSQDCIRVRAGDVLHFITSDSDVELGVSFYLIES